MREYKWGKLASYVLDNTAKSFPHEPNTSENIKVKHFFQSKSFFHHSNFLHTSSLSALKSSNCPWR